MALRFRNKMTVSPSDVQPNDAFALKVVAVAGFNHDWAAYIGPSSWSDEQVAEGGDKLTAKQAVPLFYVMNELGYRS